MTEERKLLREVLPLIPTSNTMCNGYKCREFHCISCFGEDSANEAAARNQELYERITALLAAPAPEPVVELKRQLAERDRQLAEAQRDVDRLKALVAQDRILMPKIIPWDCLDGLVAYNSPEAIISAIDAAIQEQKK